MELFGCVFLYVYFNKNPPLPSLQRQRELLGCIFLYVYCKGTSLSISVLPISDIIELIGVQSVPLPISDIIELIGPPTGFHHASFHGPELGDVLAGTTSSKGLQQDAPRVPVHHDDVIARQRMLWV